MFDFDSLVLGLLLDTALKATLLLVLVLVLGRMLRGAEASLRVRLLQVGLVGVIALLPLAALLPSWSLPMVPDPLGRFGSAVIVGHPTTVARDLANRPEGAFSRSNDEAREAWPFSSTAGRVASDPQPLAVSKLRPTTHEGVVPRAGIFIVLAWALGAAWSLRRQRVAHLKIAGLERAASVEADPSTLAALKDAVALMGVRRPVRLLVDEHLNSPMTWGHWNPVIMLPARHLGWKDERRTVVLLHELAHIRRGDWLVRVLARSACALYWFHPLAWMVLSRLIVEQERACDKAVMALGTSPTCYAQHLLSLARDEKSIAPPFPQPALSMARRPQLEVRLMSILSSNENSSPSRSAVFAVTALLVLTGLVPVLAAVEPWMQAASGPEQERVVREQTPEQPPEVVRAFEQIERELGPYEERLEAIEEEMVPVEALVETVELSLRPFEEELEAIEVEMRPLEVELATIEARLEPYEMQLEEAEVGLEPFEQRLEEMATELQPFEEQLEQLESQLEPFENRLEEAEANYERAVEPLEERLATQQGGSQEFQAAQREETLRLREELLRKVEPLRLEMESAHQEMKPLFDEMKKVHQQMSPVHERMRATHREMQPAFERMRSVHQQMESVFAEMKTVHERMQPMHESMRAVVQQMQPVMERMRDLLNDLAPFHQRVREVHREMQPLHDQMRRLHQTLEKDSRAAEDEDGS